MRRGVIGDILQRISCMMTCGVQPPHLGVMGAGLLVPRGT